MTELNVEKRDTSQKPEDLRKEGIMPAVLYGRVEESTPVAISLKEFEKTWREAGESTIITLKGLDEEKQALIYDVQMEPVKEMFLHADLYITEKGRKLSTTVPLEFVGAAPAVKDYGGTLVKVLHEVIVESIPSNLPSSLEVDVSNLDDFEKQIKVQDIELPEGVTLLEEPDEVVVLVSEGEEEPEEEEQEQPNFSEVEVEEKGKEETGEE